jgi:anti-sigma B factor antagonist
MISANGPDLSIQGRIDIDTSGTVRRAIAKALGSIPPVVTLDLAGLTYIDTSGLATLLEASRIGRQQGSRLVLVGLQGQPRELLSFSGVDQLIEIAGDMTRDQRDLRR